MQKMFRMILSLLIILFFFSGLSAQSEKEHQLDEIIVTAGRIPLPFNNVIRPVTVLTTNDISNLPAYDLPELLQYSGSIDIRQRGPFGIQSDVSLRGSTFEQVLILIDGMKVNDAQTGHHNLNLPVTPESIERIEILKGQGSRIFGPNAFSGVINIITRKEARTGLSASVSGGQHGYYNGNLNVSLPAGIINNIFSVQRSGSEGYRHNSGFDLLNLSYSSGIATPLGDANIFLGYNDKEFGANGFYANQFPNQWEHTETKLAGAAYKMNLAGFYLTPKLYWRAHNDRFLLDYSNPSFYENIHKTDIYAFELQSEIKTSIGDFALGGEFIRDQITSTNLGDHKRENKGIFSEYSFSLIKNFVMNAGAFIYNYSSVGWKIWPGIDAAYIIQPDLKIYGSYGKAFRVPTYTELYYSDPVSQGNPELHYEKSDSYEMGFGISKLSYLLNISIFRKEGKNIIDWVRSSPQEKWNVKNITEINTNGIELNFRIDPGSIITGLNLQENLFSLYSMDLSYTYLDFDKSTGTADSRYLLDHLKNHLILKFRHSLPLGITSAWAFRYEDRINSGDYFLTDLILQKKLGAFQLSVSAANLFNRSYRDINSVPLPGRWITGGIKYNFYPDQE